MWDPRTIGRVGLVLLCAAVSLATEARASGGRVILKTDNGPDGYYYNVAGAEAARFVTVYRVGDLSLDAILCGSRMRALDSSVITPGIDDYRILPDLRFEDANCPGYADLTPAGLIATADASTVRTCSTTGAPTTNTFGAGAGVPYPGTTVLLTASQPANNNPLEGGDFCGLLLDTSSLYTGDVRSQSYGVGELKGTIGFNHFLELIALEEDSALSMSIGGSSRAPGDPGIPVLFARRACDRAQADCLVGNDGFTTDDFITATVVVDNPAPMALTLNLTIEADRSVVNPMLAPKDVTQLFRSVGTGDPVANPIVFPMGRTRLDLEIKTAIRSRFVDLFPLNLPFTLRLETAVGAPGVLAEAESLLGLRPHPGYADDNENDQGFYYVAQPPVLTGDALEVQFDAEDLPKPETEWSITGLELVGGEFVTAGLPGLARVELRREDPTMPGNPDLSPAGLLRGAGRIALGPPPTTVTVDVTDVVRTAADPAEPLWLSAFLNPGDDLRTGVTAISADETRGVVLGNSYFALNNAVPRERNRRGNWMMRLLLDPPGVRGGLRSSTGPREGRPERSEVLPVNSWIPLDGQGRRIE